MEQEVIPLLDELTQIARAIPLRGDCIEILSTPDDYFQKGLLHGIENARRRLCIAALYAGVGAGRETEFLQALAAAAHSPSRPELRVHVLMDALRSTRPCPGADGRTTSTADTLGRLLLHGRAASKTTISLFHTPLLRGLLKQALPPRVREIVGVQHIKAFIFDDTVLLTGANLSNTYFSNRQDRAWLIKDAPELASLLANALDTVAQFSYPLVPPRPQGGLDTEQVRGAAVRHGDQVEKAVEYAAEYALGQCHSGVDPVTQAWKFSRSLRQALTQVFMPCGYDHASTLHRKALPLNGLQQRLDGGFMGQSHAALGYAQDGSPGDEKKAVVDWSTADTWLFPMAQAGFAGVRQEEACTLRLLAHASRAGGKLYITTPYLNLGRGYERALFYAGPGLDVQLLTSSPEANGFFGSRGLSGSIPLAYSLLEQRTWRRLVAGGAIARVGSWAQRQSHHVSEASAWVGQRSLLEYTRPGYEFHAKGIFWTPPGSKDPAVTCLGSSNLGRRSLRLDLECQTMIATRNPALRAAMAQEWAGLTEHSVPVDASHFRAPGRRSGVVKRLAVRMLRGLL